MSSIALFAGANCRHIIKPTFMTISDRIRQALKDAKISQADIARELDVTPQAVNGWLTTGRIGKASLRELAKHTRKPLDYFLDETLAPPPYKVIPTYDLELGDAPLTTAESELVRIFRKLPTEGRAKIIGDAFTMLINGRTETVADPLAGTGAHNMTPKDNDRNENKRTPVKGHRKRT